LGEERKERILFCSFLLLGDTHPKLPKERKDKELMAKVEKKGEPLIQDQLSEVTLLGRWEKKKKGREGIYAEGGEVFSLYNQFGAAWGKRVRKEVGKVQRKEKRGKGESSDTICLT